MEVTKVDVSLSHGQFFNKKQFLVVYFAMAAVCLFPLLTIILLCIPDVEWDSEMVLVVVLGNLFAFAFMSLLVYVEIKNRKLKSKIQLWLEDAVEIKAYSKKIGENRLGMQPKATKIQVRFTIDGNHYVKESTYKVFGGWEGYVGCFNKYADKEVEILYSPKYDEVMILRELK